MPDDFGLAVAPHFRDSVLAHVSGRALRLYCYLASRAAHTPGPRDVDGQTVRVDAGEHATSWRALREDVGGGLTTLVKAARELETVGALTVRQVPRTKRYQNRNAGVPKPGTHSPGAERSQTGNAAKTLVSVFNLKGLKTFARNLSVPRMGTTRVQATRALRSSLVLTAAEREELRRVDAMLAAEGR